MNRTHQQEEQQQQHNLPEQVLAAAELLLQRSRDAAAHSPWWQDASSEHIASQVESYRQAIRSVQHQLSTAQDPSLEQHLQLHQHVTPHLITRVSEAQTGASQAPAERGAGAAGTQEQSQSMDLDECPDTFQETGSKACNPHALIAKSTHHSLPLDPNQGKHGIGVTHRSASPDATGAPNADKPCNPNEPSTGTARHVADREHNPSADPGTDSSLGRTPTPEPDQNATSDGTPEPQADQPIPPHSIPIHANVMTYNWGPLIQSCQFDVIMMDPPWQLATANPTRGVALGYSQLNDEAIASLPVPELQQNGFLFVWVINAKYKWTLDLFERWGYEMVDEVVWVKMTVNRRLAKSHGYYLQHAKEVCLVGKRGFDPPGLSPTGVASDIIFSERRGQSQKPTEIYDLIEALVPNGRYLEIFARRNNLRDYWVSIGNEVTGTGLPPEDLASIAENKRITGAVYGRGNTLK